MYIISVQEKIKMRKLCNEQKELTKVLVIVKDFKGFPFLESPSTGRLMAIIGMLTLQEMCYELFIE